MKKRRKTAITSIKGFNKYAYMHNQVMKLLDIVKSHGVSMPVKLLPPPRRTNAKP